jgi:hypothetical protein
MNKTERLKALQAEYAAKFQAIVDEPEAPEPVGSLLPQNWGPYCCHMIAQEAFKSRDQMKAYASAINTLIELRRQPGTEKPDDSKRQWNIGITSGEVKPCFYNGANVRMDMISPCFATEEQAEAAKEKIGADRLKQMFNTLHGVE